MKYVAYCMLTLCVILMSCDGADHEILSDDHCYLVINIVDIRTDDRQAECDITFLFIDEEGNEFTQTKGVPEDAGSSTIVALPKNRCYNAWVLDVGTGSCGFYKFQVESEDGPCFVFEEFVDDRLDVYSETSPEFSFCLDNECNCPEVKEN